MQAVVTADAKLITKAEKVIFPGVGAAPSAMANLKKTGLDRVIVDVFKAGAPFLGICIGAQVVLESSEEGPVERAWASCRARRCALN